MKNKTLITNWKKYSIQFKISQEIKKMDDMFMICWGEKEIDIDGTKEKLVIFDEGGEQGSPSLWCHSDKNNLCWAFAWDSNKKKAVKINIGKFVKE